MIEFEAADVQSLSFIGGDGDDTFVNNTRLPSLAYGNSGNDTLIGGRSSDEQNGGPDDDILRGRGGDGNDYLSGYKGDDVIRGGAGNGKLKGHEGNDELFGDSGNDKIYGWKGDDLLVGGTGNDYLSAWSGDGILVGGKEKMIFVVTQATTFCLTVVTLTSWTAEPVKTSSCQDQPISTMMSEHWTK